MQYHLNGYRPGDPSVAEKHDKINEYDHNVDVLIIGCGPTGLTLATQLSTFPELNIRIVDRKAGPLMVGQADGLACRSVEMFQAFGFAEKVLKEAYSVNEVAFWRPSPDHKGLHRADLIPDVEDDLSEMPHLILNQARVHDFYLETMRNSAHGLSPTYHRELDSLTRTENLQYPLTATFKCLEDNTKDECVNARFVVGCDGARSIVRKYLGHELKGSSARQLWGVMDILAVTNFPDIRKKAAIQSEDSGSLLIIPREGGYMVRMYIELGELHAGERAADRQVTATMLADKARDILAPYTLDVKEVPWWSAYEIGQRVCDSFDNIPEDKRADQSPDIFIAGDACHTHSPKAGQGMNVGMADAFNLGWKLAAVLRNQTTPDLLHTYSLERQAKARELIDFDKDMARLFSAKTKSADDAAQFQRYFRQHGRYTAGVETRYEQSLITSMPDNQTLATGLLTGMRFHSDNVVRVSDAQRMQLGHVHQADGRWRLYLFVGADDNGQAGGEVARLCKYLDENEESPLLRYTSNTTDIDSIFDIRAVFQTHYHALPVDDMPKLLKPAKGAYGLTDYEKIFAVVPDHSPDIFDSRGIDRSKGALIVVRPDQYIAGVYSLHDFAGLSAFFRRFMVAQDIIA